MGVGLENIIVTIDLDKDGNDKYDDDKKKSKSKISTSPMQIGTKEMEINKIKLKNDLKERTKLSANI